MTDLMASIAVVFLLIAAAAMYLVTHAKEGAANKRFQNEKITLLNQLAEILRIENDFRKNLIGHSDCVELDGRDRFFIRIRFKSDPKICKDGLSFEGGRFQLTEINRQYLKTIVSPIFKKICDVYQGQDAVLKVSRLELVGHTDSVWYVRDKKNQSFWDCGFSEDSELGSGRDLPRESFCNNVELSTRRAQAVFFEVRRLLNPDGRSGDPTVSQACMDTAFTVSGRGPTDPAEGASPWSSEFVHGRDNSASRRVELVVAFREISKGAE